jgi:hypothetical protein
MGKINYGRVILGGIVGGLVAGFLDWFFNGVLMSQLWADAAKTLNLNMNGPAFFFMLFLVFILGGILMVWVYAAMRPRFGAGVRTAVYAGLVAWAFSILLPNMMNIVTSPYNNPRLMLYTTLFAIVELVAGAIVGAWLYKEAESTAAYPAAEARQAAR